MRSSRFGNLKQRVDGRLGLGSSGLAAVACGTAVLIGLVVIFGAATEDVAGSDGLTRHDPGLLRLFTAHRSAPLVGASKVITDFGTVAVVAAFAAVASIWLWRRGMRIALALAPVASFTVAAVGVGAVKGIIGRARPPVSLHLVSESDASFPSGHTTDSAAVFMTIALVVALFVLRRPVARFATVLGAALLSGAIGLSRLVLGVHWPSDVLAGWALGAGVAIAVTAAVSLLAHPSPPPAETPRGHIRRVGSMVSQLMTGERRTRTGLRATKLSGVSAEPIH
jgi:membrane-associated phospholipid phosphatase